MVQNRVPESEQVDEGLNGLEGKLGLWVCTGITVCTHVCICTLTLCESMLQTSQDMRTITFINNLDIW